MKKVVLSLAAVLAVSAAAPAFAADMPAKAPKVAPAPPPSPWDIAFGAAHHERLHLPRRDPVGPQAIGRGLFRAALQHQFELATLRRSSPARASSSPTTRPRKSTSTAASVRRAVRSPSIWATGTTTIRAVSATAPARRKASIRVASPAAFRRTSTSQNQSRASMKCMARSPTLGPTGRSARTSIIRRTS